jgi:hypothetical protein
MAGIGVEDGNDLGLGLPIRDVVLDDLDMEQCGGQVALELERTDAEQSLHLRQLDGDVYVERLG